MKKLLNFCVLTVSLIFIFSAPAWSNGLVIGLGDLPEGKVDSQPGIISKTALRITTAHCEEPNDMST